jgi:hypothetical protein
MVGLRSSIGKTSGRRRGPEGLITATVVYAQKGAQDVDGHGLWLGSKQCDIREVLLVVFCRKSECFGV